MFWKPELDRRKRPDGATRPPISVRSPLDPFAFIVYPRELAERAEAAAGRLEELRMRAVRYNPREPWEDPVAVVAEGIGEAVVVVVVEPGPSGSKWLTAELAYAHASGVPRVADGDLAGEECQRRVAELRRRWCRAHWRTTLQALGENIGVPVFVRGARLLIVVGSVSAYFVFRSPLAFLLGFGAAVALAALSFFFSGPGERDRETARLVEAQRLRILHSFAAVPERPSPEFVDGLAEWGESGDYVRTTWLGEGSAAAGSATLQLVAFLITTAFEYFR